MERTMSLPKVTQALLHNVLIKSFNNLSDNTTFVSEYKFQVKHL